MILQTRGGPNGHVACVRLRRAEVPVALIPRNSLFVKTAQKQELSKTEWNDEMPHRIRESGSSYRLLRALALNPKDNHRACALDLSPSCHATGQRFRSNERLPWAAMGLLQLVLLERARRSLAPPILFTPEKLSAPMWLAERGAGPSDDMSMPNATARDAGMQSVFDLSRQSETRDE